MRGRSALAVLALVPVVAVPALELSMGPLAYALVAVIVGAAVACLLQEKWSAVGVGVGALAALLHTALLDTTLVPIAGLVAATATMALLYTPRALRARSLLGAAVQVGLAALGGALGTAIVAAYAEATIPVLLAAIGVATLLAAAPLAVPIDDPVAHALLSFARRTSGVYRTRMLRAVALRRRAATVGIGLSARAEKRVERAWSALVRAAADRQEGARVSRLVLDGRITAYIQALQRATFAAGTATELSKDLDDIVLAELELERDDLVARADALAEVHGPRRTCSGTQPEEAQPETQPEAQRGFVTSASVGARSTAVGSVGMASSGAIGHGQFELASFVVGSDDELEVSSTAR